MEGSSSSLGSDRRFCSLRVASDRKVPFNEENHVFILRSQRWTSVSALLLMIWDFRLLNGLLRGKAYECRNIRWSVAPPKAISEGYNYLGRNCDTDSFFPSHGVCQFGERAWCKNNSNAQKSGFSLEACLGRRV